MLAHRITGRWLQLGEHELMDSLTWELGVQPVIGRKGKELGTSFGQVTPRSTNADQVSRGTSTPHFDWSSGGRRI